MRDDDDSDPALRAANQSLSGRRHHHASRLSSLDPGSTDPAARTWELGAVISVVVVTGLVLLVFWLST